ncbi:hypothetical protein BH10ACT11_BH10ACT11_11110 [soil metagenome]
MSEDVNIPIVGAAGEPCGSCGAPLAADQRYCLQCGTRRGAARVDFERHLGARQTAADGPSPAASPVPIAPAATLQPKVLTPLAIVGGIATLGVMLVLGVLIGKDNTSATPTTPVASNPPKVVVQAGPGSASAATTSNSAGATDKKAAKTTGKADKAGGQKVAAAGPIDTGDAATVGDDALGALDTGDTAANSKASAELPDTIATEGTPDKPDNKEPGAGTAATVIK